MVNLHRAQIKHRELSGLLDVAVGVPWGATEKLRLRLPDASIQSPIGAEFVGGGNRHAGCWQTGPSDLP